MSEFAGYFAKPDITALAPNCLVPGSKNVLVDYALRVISRPGYILYNQANTGGQGIVSSYEWQTSSGSEFSLRTHDYLLEFDWNGQYNTLLSNLQTASMEFAKVLDYTEQQDVLLFVKGDANMYRWSGGATKVWQSSPTTVTKQGVLGPVVIGNPTISLASPGVVTLANHGLSNGNTVQFSVTGGIMPLGLAVNTTYYVSVIDANTFNVSSSVSLTPLINTAAQTVTISIANPAVITLANHGLLPGDQVYFNTSGALPTGMAAGGANVYYVLGTNITTNTFEISTTNGGAPIITSGTQSGTQTMVMNNPTYSMNNAAFALSISFVAAQTPGSTSATILDSNNNFLNAGFAAGDIITVVGSAGNSRQFTILSVTAGIISLNIADVLVTEAVGQTVTIYNQTGPTFKFARFFSVHGASIVYKGVTYGYTPSSANSSTLSGLTAFPTVAVGDVVWQAVDTLPLSAAITGPFPNFYPDLIGQQLNVIVLGSTQSVMTFGSSDSDYTNFTLTDPRAPGDPFQEPLIDGPCTCIVPVDTDANQLSLNDINTLIFGSGKDSFDQIDFHMSADNSEELVRIIRYRIAKGMGLLSKDAICPIKNDTVYISREPTLLSLSEKGLEAPDGQRNVPISDPIKNDFDLYDFTAAHVVYWKRAIWIALPAEGLVLMYDMMRNIWQPPMTIPVSRLFVINDWLYGHSAVSNETYKLWTGTNDNQTPIEQVARFAYNNGGRRDRLKNMATYWTDGYISANGTLNMDVFFGYEGSQGIRSFEILGTDSSLVTERSASPLGNQPLGNVPLGGANPASAGGLQEDASLLRFQWPQTLAPDDFFEHFVEYTMNTMDGQFALVAHGSDQWDAATAPVSRNK